jgi:hypothetical protein
MLSKASAFAVPSPHALVLISTSEPVVHIASEHAVIDLMSQTIPRSAQKSNISCVSGRPPTMIPPTAGTAGSN